ncbi:MAG: DUF4097 family beta strand repeat protein [Oscillospiraceae bacterium]|nr:DUF4097 family beta strand repeat protein [Oscillospiraceae bacterium]
MEKQIYRFNAGTIETVEVSSLGAKIIMKSHDSDEIYAEYDNPKDSPEFCAVLSGTTLTFKEKLSFSIFGTKPTEGYTITVMLPKKLFGKIKVNTASGGVEINDITAADFDLNTASGNININSFFESVKIQSASGNIVLTCPEEKTAKSVTVCTVSGSADISCYKAEEFSVHSVSGVTTYNGASGKGKIAVTSGSVNVNYAEWNNDLDISAISGTINITLPENSGADIKFEGVSGNLRTDIGMAKGQSMNLGKGTSGVIGGENCHKVSISLTSGNVNIMQQ